MLHRRQWLLGSALAFAAGRTVAGRQDAIEYRVLATTKTSTMEKEMNDAARLGFRFQAVMGGETAMGGKEVVIVLGRTSGAQDQFQYRLLATQRTSQMQRELDDATELGFEYRGQTVFESMFGGREVVCILERHADRKTAAGIKYRLVATSKTSTMQKELEQAGAEGFEVVGMTVAKTAVGGNELVTILRRQAR